MASTALGPPKRNLIKAEALGLEGVPISLIGLFKLAETLVSDGFRNAVEGLRASDSGKWLKAEAAMCLLPGVLTQATKTVMVTGGLSIVAFATALTLHCYRALLRQRVSIILFAPHEVRDRVVDVVATSLRIKIDTLASERKQKFVIEQLNIMIEQSRWQCIVAIDVALCLIELMIIIYFLLFCV